MSLSRENYLIAKSSLSAARKKISWIFFRSLVHKIADLADAELGDQILWRGHRVYAIDGSMLNLPHEFKRIKYRAPNERCFYPQGLLTMLIQLKSGVPCDFVLSRHNAEGRTVAEHLKHVKPGSVVIYDRLYFCKDILKTHLKMSIDAVFRLKRKNTLKEVVKFVESGASEQIVDIVRKGFHTKIRFIRYKIAGKEYYLATTLLDAKKYDLQSLKALYHSRWGIEESFKFIKREIELENFHSKSTNGVKQEIACSLLLAAMSKFLTFNPKKRQKACMGVTKTVLVSQLPHFWTKGGLVRTAAVDRMLTIGSHYKHQSPSGRSFPRRSRKVINRWQKNISHEWRQKKSLQSQGIPP